MFAIVNLSPSGVPSIGHKVAVGCIDFDPDLFDIVSSQLEELSSSMYPCC